MECNECKVNSVHSDEDEQYCHKRFDELKYLQRMNDPDWIGMCIQQGCWGRADRLTELCDDHKGE